ncbi:MAG: hypothetical protein JOY66_00305 [Acetobacteraceae bacterium]|nr:hypothetical protein [Acetobacteraceae bacterium]
MTDGPAGERALALIDKLLAERPEKVGHDFSETTRCLSAYRDELIGRFRETGAERDRARLDGVNAVLSVIVSGHFPLGDIPWGHIEEAHKRLEGLVHDRPD